MASSSASATITSEPSAASVEGAMSAVTSAVVSTSGMGGSSLVRMREAGEYTAALHGCMRRIGTALKSLWFHERLNGEVPVDLPGNYYLLLKTIRLSTEGWQFGVCSNGRVAESMSEGSRAATAARRFVCYEKWCNQALTLVRGGGAMPVLPMEFSYFHHMCSKLLSKRLALNHRVIREASRGVSWALQILEDNGVILRLGRRRKGAEAKKKIRVSGVPIQKRRKMSKPRRVSPAVQMETRLSKIVAAHRLSLLGDLTVTIDSVPIMGSDVPVSNDLVQVVKDGGNEVPVILASVSVGPVEGSAKSEVVLPDVAMDLDETETGAPGEFTVPTLPRFSTAFGGDTPVGLFMPGLAPATWEWLESGDRPTWTVSGGDEPVGDAIPVDSDEYQALVEEAVSSAEALLAGVDVEHELACYDQL
jgi:hypothetical protein